MKNRSGEKIKLASIDELLGVVNEESAMEIEISKIHPFKNHPFKVLDDEKMQDLVESVRINGVLIWLILFVIGLAVKMTVQTYAVVRGILGFIFTLLIIATAYCYHDWVQVAFLFSLSVILYLILFAGVFVDTVLDMTRERIIDFIIS